MPRDAKLSRHNLVFGGVARTHDHDAAMRISGEAPGSGTNLCNGESQAFKRYTATSDHDRTFNVSPENADIVSFYCPLLFVSRRYASQ